MFGVINLKIKLINYYDLTILKFIALIVIIVYNVIMKEFYCKIDVKILGNAYINYRLMKIFIKIMDNKKQVITI